MTGPDRHPRRPTQGTAWSRTWQAVARRSVRGSADVALLLLDAGLVALAFTIMLVLRYEIEVPADAWAGFRTFLLIAIPLQLLINRLAGLYGPVWQHASIYEAQRILLAGAASTMILTWWVLLTDRLVPLSVALTGGVIATGLMGVLRFQSRLFAYHRGQRVDAVRVLIVGAGESGSAMLREMDRKPEAGVRPVAMLDDDPRKLGRWVGNVPIVGRVEDLPEVVDRLQVEQVLLAVPSADSALVRRVADDCSDLGIALKVLPSVAELMNGRPRLTDVRDLSIDDLLGRQPIATDLASVGAMIRGRRVLVTGGGGSIGSEIVRQVSAYGPARLVVLDRDETHLFDAMAEIDGAGIPALVDVRDQEQLRQLFLRERPEIVYHAAANKHVPLLEAHPCEAAATNVLGTENVVNLARTFGVEHLVFVSTDKAVRPSSVMGATKRLGEHIVLAGAPEGSHWCAVRFGNVLGSRGSVVPTFVRQIRQGGPVTVTDAQMTRYFMSIPEAVQLVLQAAALADGRDVFMLDMGEPVRIVDLANRMIALAGYRVGVDIEVRITGLRPGEKLSEELHTDDEAPAPTSHPKLVRLSPTVPEPQTVVRVIGQLALAIASRDDAAVRDLLFAGAEGKHGVERPFDAERSWTEAAGRFVHVAPVTDLPPHPHAGDAVVRTDAAAP